MLIDMTIYMRNYAAQSLLGLVKRLSSFLNMLHSNLSILLGSFTCPFERGGQKDYQKDYQKYDLNAPNNVSRNKF